MKIFLLLLLFLGGCASSLPQKEESPHLLSEKEVSVASCDASRIMGVMQNNKKKHHSLDRTGVSAECAVGEKYQGGIVFSQDYKDSLGKYTLSVREKRTGKKTCPTVLREVLGVYSPQNRPTKEVRVSAVFLQERTKNGCSSWGSAVAGSEALKKETLSAMDSLPLSLRFSIDGWTQ